MKTISIRQPWAHLILYCGKDIENRSWPTRFRGSVLIHASKGMTVEEWEDAMSFARGVRAKNHFKVEKNATFKDVQRGGIVGIASIVDCVTSSESPWFVGEYGFVIANVRPVPFHPCKGALGFFDVEYPHVIP
jgi:hypothetical protein